MSRVVCTVRERQVHGDRERGASGEHDVGRIKDEIPRKDTSRGVQRDPVVNVAGISRREKDCPRCGGILKVGRVQGETPERTEIGLPSCIRVEGGQVKGRIERDSAEIGRSPLNRFPERGQDV